MIKTLLHITPSLEAILQSGFLRSASRLGKQGTEGEDVDAIYFTPTDNKGIPVPFSHKTASVIHLDAQRVLQDFPMFFMNETNAFGPLDGQPLKSGSCKCRNTYNTHTKKSGPCVHETLESIANVLVYDFNHCDGGPELGVYQDVPLAPYLLYITVPKKEYSKLPEDLKRRYGDKLRVV